VGLNEFPYKMTSELLFHARVKLGGIYDELSNISYISVSTNYKFIETNKNSYVCYYLRYDSLTTHCVSRCVIAARLGNVEHVRRQE